MAFERNFNCYSKYAQWGGDSGLVYIDYWGDDWSGANFKWVFAYQNDLTQAFALDDATAGSEGISVTYSASETNPYNGVVEGRTRIVPQANEPTLEGLTYSGVSDLVLVHTLFVAPSGLSQFPIVFGNLTIRQGAPD